MYEEVYFGANIDKINRIILNLYSKQNKGISYYLDFLRELQELIYFDFGNIVFFRSDGEEPYLDYFCQIGWKDVIEKEYVTHFYKEDDVFPIFMKKSFVVMRSTDMFDKSRTMSQYYMSFMKNAGFDRSLECNIVLSEEKNTYGICSLFRELPKQDFTEEDKRTLGLIQPHLSNAIQQVRLSVTNSAREREYENFFSGRAVIGTSGKVFYMCKGFERIFKRHDDTMILLSKVQEILTGNEQESFHTHFYKFEDIPILIEYKKIEMEGEKEFVYDCRAYDVSLIIHYYISRSIAAYGLTQREQDILKMRLIGLDREEISKKLFISVPTIKKHIAAIYQKMGIKNQNQILTKLQIFTDDQKTFPFQKEER